MKPIRVVVAEDDERIAEIQQRFLQKVGGFEVVGLSHNLEDTDEMIKILQPDLLLLDIHFPDGNGLNYLKKLRDEEGHTDVILITAAKDIETLKSAIHGGVFDYIVKPIVFNRFQDSLEQYLVHSRRLKSLQQIEQQDIDKLIPRVRSNARNKNLETGLPKGIDSLTLNKIRTLFSDTEGSFGASSVGEAIGVSRTTGRRYLEYMVSTQELIVDVSYGGVGRPERHYCRA